ncbi:MAG: restriction endonuclease [Actinomycetes bacterium]
MSQIVFEKLGSADLVIDANYQGRPGGMSFGDAPLQHLIPGIGNQGGFRIRKGIDSNVVGMVLTSSGAEPDWPDYLNPADGTYIYFGDNRSPGKALHDTKAKGNATLAEVFRLAGGDASDRAKCPLTLIFESGDKGRDMIFRGLAVPGSKHFTIDEALVAVWRNAKGERFQNYRAVFTILNCGEINGDWVRQVFRDRQLDLNDDRIPLAFRHWVNTGKITALEADPTRLRDVSEQRPRTGAAASIIQEIFDFCSDDPWLFEPIAAEIWRLSCATPMEYELTRRYRDGGRDAIGYLKLGPANDIVKISFALEAKLYSPSNRVGVKETSRLISRIRHREFGVLVTTSVVDAQAYKEIRSDGHPIVVISGADIADILIQKGISTPEKCRRWIEGEFNVPPPEELEKAEKRSAAS